MWDKKFVKSDRKKFLHLIEYLIEAIDAGKLQPGESLPTQRDLSKKLNLSIGTITKAFKELEKMGYLSGEIGRGTFVKDIAAEYKDFWYTEAKVPYKYNLGNFRTTELFNHTIQLNLLSAIREVSNDPNLYLKLNDLSNCGTEEQKISFLDWLKSVGVKSAGAENISLLATEFLTSNLLITSLTRPGDRIVIESVSDPVVKEQISENQRTAIAVDVDLKGIVPDDLDEICKKHKPSILFSNPTFQNPTGNITPLSRKKEIMRVCDRHGLRIIEIGNLDFFSEKTIHPYVELNSELGIYVSNMYFHINPSINTSCVVAARKHLKQIEKNFRITYWTSSQILLETSAKLITSGRASRIIDERTKMIQSRSDLFGKVFKEDEFSGGRNGVLRWLKIPETWTSSGLTQSAYEKGILIRNSDIFTHNSATMPPYVRICNGAIHNDKDYLDAIRELKDLMEDPPLKR
ncbi:MAG: PLP-dependent aminotransferase family protein [Cyclobacteriaceae bacterium]